MGVSIALKGSRVSPFPAKHLRFPSVLLRSAAFTYARLLSTRADYNMSDADDSFLSEEDSSEVAELTKHCINMKPKVISNLTKSKSKPLSLRARLEKFRTCASRERTSRRSENRKQVEDHFKELASDFSSFNKKFDVAISSFTEILNRSESVEKGIGILEKNNVSNSTTETAPTASSYANVGSPAPTQQRPHR